MTRNAIALALMLSGAAAAAPLWVGDFETGDYLQWSDRIDVQPGTTDRITVVTSPVAQGRYALKATVYPGDLVNSGNRAELVLRNPMFRQGDEVWFHWFTMFPEDFQTTLDWVLWTQCHGSGFGFPITFNLHGNELNMRVMAHAYDAAGDWEGGVLWKAPLEKGKWMEFVLHVKFSDSDDGFVELWKDGQLVVPKTNHPTLDPGDYCYLKQGIYRNKNISYPMTIYHDGMTVDTKRPEDVFAQWSSGQTGAGQPIGGAGITGPESGAGCAAGGAGPLDAALLSLGGALLALRRRRR
jgi:hypothetical protein